jgi:4-hydroxy-2-oxoheptanedioate aldolase
MTRRWLTPSEQPALGIWINIPDAFVAEAMGTIGFDYVCLDLQHGLSDLASLRHSLMALRTSSAVPVVRVLRNDAGLIGQALDYGAVGVIVPMVDTPEQAANAVAACRYAPIGVRSFGPLRHSLRGPIDPATMNREARCIVMVETAAGLANVEKIAEVPGLDGIYIGPSDLAISLGVPVSEFASSAVHRAALHRIRDAALGAGIIAGLHCAGVASARVALADGFTMITTAADANLLRQGAAQTLAGVRAADSSA